MIGGLVQEENVRGLEKQSAQRDPPFFAAGYHRDRHLAGRTPEGFHGHFQPGVEVPGIQGVELFLDLPLPGDQPIHLIIGQGLGELLGDPVELVHEGGGLPCPFGDHLPDRPILVYQRLLGQKAHGVAVGEDGFAVVLGVIPGHDPQKAALPRPVQSQDPDFGAVKIGQGNVL